MLPPLHTFGRAFAVYAHCPHAFAERCGQQRRCERARISKWQFSLAVLPHLLPYLTYAGRAYLPHLAPLYLGSLPVTSRARCILPLAHIHATTYLPLPTAAVSRCCRTLPLPPAAYTCRHYRAAHRRICLMPRMPPYRTRPRLPRAQHMHFALPAYFRTLHLVPAFALPITPAACLPLYTCRYSTAYTAHFTQQPLPPHIRTSTALRLPTHLHHACLPGIAANWCHHQRVQQNSSATISVGRAFDIGPG